MATIVSYKCECGQQCSVYIPHLSMVLDAKKKYIQAAKEWDEADVARGDIERAKQAAIDAGITFINAGTVEAYECKCGRTIEPIDFILKWLKYIRNRRRL